ncbi:hypothetical protein EUGRSUZ_G00053 [Eucalyptus grandis]|uniref:Uncharacterized protein n=2 Tax=Eucalyptus grandis TaxID=71139 RepID=A0ACC3JZE6_EUCGR|nr:hypothetical protein EUGRSUZ_G00053 [Eucalyptus grandis]
MAGRGCRPHQPIAGGRERERERTTPTTHFSFHSDTEEEGSGARRRRQRGHVAERRWWLPHQFSLWFPRVALPAQPWSERAEEEGGEGEPKVCSFRREDWWVLSMKAISTSSSSSPPPSPSPPPSHFAASLLSSRSYSSWSGGHASPACFHRRRLGGGETRVKFVVVMAKKKKPPSPSSSSSSSSSSSHQASDSTPLRITSNVKQNLQFLKLWKEFQKRNSGIPKPATSYRRKKLPKEDLLDDDMELYGDPTLALYHTNQGIESAVPVLLVDGYNVCGYWAKLKKHFMSGRLDIARQKLIDELVSFSMLREVKVVVVFDAMMSGLPTHKEIFAGVDIIYSGESCADAWIEKEVVALKEDGCPRVWVVTSDRCQQQAAYGAFFFESMDV